MEFKFLNTNYNLSYIKAGVSIKDNKLLKNFDKNNNSIFDAEEVSEFMNKLLPYIEDNVFDNNEAFSFLSEVLGISSTEAQKQLQNNDNEIEAAFKTLINEQAKRDSINYNNAEIDQALEIYETAMGGWVSKGCNTIKELFNSNYAGDKIYRQLVRNKASAMMLERSNNNNLTVKEYAEMKIELLEALLGGDKLSDADKNAVINSAKQLDLESVDSLIEKLVNAEDSEYENVKAETLKNLKKTSEQNRDYDIGFRKLNKNSLGAIITFHGDEILKFENVFEYENGVKFNADKINAYNDKQRDFNRIASLNNRIAHQYNDLDEAIKENNSKNLRETINSALDDIFGNNETAKSEFIAKLGFNPLYNLPDEKLVMVAQKLQEELIAQRDRLLDGKTLDQHIQELGESKDNAFGKKHNIDLASRFAESQENWVAGTKMVASGVGFIATLAGGPIALAGVALSIGGGAGISFVEEASKPGNIPADKQKEILKELAVSGALNLAGFGSGAAASSIGKIVASKCPKLVAAITEYGSDAVMSLIADVAITGEVDLKGEGIAQLINIATGIALHKKVKNQTSSTSTSGKMEHNNPARVSTPGRTVNDVMPLIESMCKKYNMNIDVVVNSYLKDLSTELEIFKNEEVLKEYIETVFKLTNKRNSGGNLIYSKNVLHYGNNRVEKMIDYKLIQEIATLKATSPKCKEQLDRLCYLVEKGKITPYQLRKTLTYFKEGYISPSTIDISLSENNGLKITDLIDDIKPERNTKKERKKIIDTIERFNPKIKEAIKALKKDIGDDIYKIKWEMITNKNLDEKDYLAFISDIKNIKYLKKIEVETQNFFIKIPGYGQNNDWANEMAEITESASHMLREGATFDEAMAYIAASARDLALKGKVNLALEKEDRYMCQVYGIVRGQKDNYMSDVNYENRGAITPFDEGTKYYAYADKFRKCYSPNELKNPYAGRIELTRVFPDGTYPIEASKYNPSNPEHVKIVNPDGSTSYYEIRESMIHPKGKYGVEGLNIAEELHNKLVDKFKNKTITSKDLDEINETVAEIHWVLAHTMPWGRGSDAIANSYVKAVYQSLGIKTYPPKEGVSFDLEAFCTELDDYKKNYKKLYEKDPEIVK